MPFALGQCFYLYFGKNIQNLPSASQIYVPLVIANGFTGSFSITRGRESMKWRFFHISKLVFVLENTHERAELTCPSLYHLVILSSVKKFSYVMVYIR